MPITNETALYTYQNFDGSNTTMLLRSFHNKMDQHATLSGAFGVSTNFHGTNSFVLEGKAKYALDDHFSAQLRSRNTFASGNSASQMRLSAEYKTKVSDKASIYVDPYVAAKYNYNSQQFSTDEGLFVGATYKITPKVSVSGEVQKYNGLDCSAENWGVNAILSYNF